MKSRLLYTVCALVFIAGSANAYDYSGYGTERSNGETYIERSNRETAEYLRRSEEQYQMRKQQEQLREIQKQNEEILEELRKQQGSQ